MEPEALLRWVDILDLETAVLGLVTFLVAQAKGWVYLRPHVSHLEKQIIELQRVAQEFRAIGNAIHTRRK